MPTSGDTLIRRILAAANEPEPNYRFVGVDDFAIRKGQVYGTILIDLERHRVIDLWDGRDERERPNFRNRGKIVGALLATVRHHPQLPEVLCDSGDQPRQVG